MHVSMICPYCATITEDRAPNGDYCPKCKKMVEAVQDVAVCSRCGHQIGLEYNCICGVSLEIIKPIQRRLHIMKTIHAAEEQAYP